MSANSVGAAGQEALRSGRLLISQRAVASREPPLVSRIAINFRIYSAFSEIPVEYIFNPRGEIIIRLMCGAGRACRPHLHVSITVATPPLKSCRSANNIYVEHPLKNLDYSYRTE